jgi:hypothetical protein
MERELAIYVSAASELDPECELVGQLLAEIPRSLRWRIRRTPGPFQPSNPDLEGLKASDFYLILMASDIYAPVGVEAQCALHEHLPLFAYRKLSAIPSPATAHFVHHVGIVWQPYQTAVEFARRFERELIEQLVGGTPGYGLQVADVDDLLARLEALKEPAAFRGTEERRGAGRGGVILEG